MKGWIKRVWVSESAHNRLQHLHYYFHKYKWDSATIHNFLFFPVGEKLIKDLLDDFLFPASKLIFDTRSTPSKETVIDVHPK